MPDYEIARAPAELPRPKDHVGEHERGAVANETEQGGEDLRLPKPKHVGREALNHAVADGLFDRHFGFRVGGHKDPDGDEL